MKKVIKNNILPFKGFGILNLFGFLFVRKEELIGITDLNHECIHTAQMKEMLYISFYIWYIVEWLIKLVIYKDAHTAYRNISFEREAYMYEEDMQYLKKRKKFAWLHCLFSF